MEEKSSFSTIDEEKTQHLTTMVHAKSGLQYVSEDSLLQVPVFFLSFHLSSKSIQVSSIIYSHLHSLHRN